MDKITLTFKSISSEPPYYVDLLLDIGDRLLVGFYHPSGRFYQDYYSDGQEVYPEKWAILPKTC